jgi:hypothetical protein
LKSSIFKYITTSVFVRYHTKTIYKEEVMSLDLNGIDGVTFQTGMDGYGYVVDPELHCESVFAATQCAFDVTIPDFADLLKCQDDDALLTKKVPPNVTINESSSDESALQSKQHVKTKEMAPSEVTGVTAEKKAGTKRNIVGANDDDNRRKRSKNKNDFPSLTPEERFTLIDEYFMCARSDSDFAEKVLNNKARYDQVHSFFKSHITVLESHEKKPIHEIENAKEKMVKIVTDKFYGNMNFTKTLVLSKEDLGGASSPYERFKECVLARREKIAINSKRKRTKPKVAWTQPETEELMNAIIIYGNKWREIKKFFPDRSHCQLKDKFEEMAESFLKGKEISPPQDYQDKPVNYKIEEEMDGELFEEFGEMLKHNIL